MAQPFRRTRLTWLAYLLLAFYSYFINVLGPITPFLKAELGLSYTVASLHFTAFAAGILLVSLFGERMIRRLGRWTAQWVGAGGLGLGALLLVAGRSAPLTITAAFLMGLVGSLILILIPSNLSDQYGELRAVAISEANMIASFFAAIGPLLVGAFVLLGGGWRLAVGLVALAPIALRLGFGARPAEPLVRTSAPGEQSEPATTLPAASGVCVQNSPACRPLPRLFWVYWAALVFSVAVEFCMLSWSADYLETGLGVPRAMAAQAVSLFLGGMIVGRLAGSLLVQRFPTASVVIFSALLASAGFLLFWTVSSALAGLVGLFITGLGVASLYPLIQSLALGTAGPGQSALASARTTLASGTAVLTLPLILGRLADAFTIRPAYGVVVLLLAAVLAIIQFTRRSGFPTVQQFQG
jgi:fucose permease